MVDDLDEPIILKKLEDENINAAEIADVVVKNPPGVQVIMKHPFFHMGATAAGYVHLPSSSALIQFIKAEAYSIFEPYLTE